MKMMMKSYRTVFLSLALCAGALASSCTKDVIVIGSSDDSLYDNVSQINGYVRDAGKAVYERALDIYEDQAVAEIVFGLNRAPGKGVDVTLGYDAEYAAAKAEELGDGYRAFPQEMFSLAKEALTLAPDDRKSDRIAVTINIDKNIADTVTYILPIKASTSTEGVNIPESTGRCVYYVRNCSNMEDCNKGDDKLKTFLYFEVNDTNPLNALEFKLADSGKLYFDYVTLFAANINYNAETGRVYVACNPNVQFLLDNNEQYIQPLRRRGIKVLLGLLGNHDESGLAQLSEVGAQMFAAELAAICREYNLDGVNFDDEYSDSPDLSNPLFTRTSSEAAMRLCYETKRAMPEKLVTIYDWGYMYGDHRIDGTVPGEFVDIVVPNYGYTTSPAEGMTNKDCAGLAVELRQSPHATVDKVKKVVEEGWGYVMMFSLYPEEYDDQMEAVNNICIGLYDQELAPVTHYYKKNDTTRYELGK